MQRSACFESPGRVSASMPRSEKTASAAGESLSAMRTLNIASRGVQLVPRPVEPGRKRLDVARVDGGAAPDAQTRRGRAMRRDIEGDPFLFEYRGKPADRGELIGHGKARKRTVHDFETHRSGGADAFVGRVERRPFGRAH